MGLRGRGKWGVVVEGCSSHTHTDCYRLLWFRSSYPSVCCCSVIVLSGRSHPSLYSTHTHLSICWRIWSIFLSFSADFCCFPADDCVQNHSNLLASGLKALISHVCSKYLFFFRVKNTTSVVLMVENRTTFQMYPHWPQEALKGEIKTTSRTSKTCQRTTTTSQRTSDHLRSQSSTVTLQHHTHTAGRLH